MNKTFLTIFITVSIVLLLGWVVFISSEKQSWIFGSELEASSVMKVSSTKIISLYYYQPRNDISETGVLQCSEAGLVPVAREVPLDTTITETLELLLAGGLTTQQRQRGVTTEFPLLGLKLVGLRIDDGTATVALDDPQRSTGGGACRASILRGQVEQTLEQFSGVTEVRFLPDTLFQP